MPGEPLPRTRSHSVGSSSAAHRASRSDSSASNPDTQVNEGRSRPIGLGALSPGSFVAQPYSPWSDAPFGYTAPAFRAEWEREFAEQYYRPKSARLGAGVMMVSGIGLCVLHVLSEDGGRGGALWAMLNWGGEAVCGILSCFVVLVLSVPACRPFAVRNQNILSAVWTSTCIIAWNSVLAFDELRRSQFQMPPDEFGGTANITYHRGVRALGGGLEVPEITCQDADAVTTILQRSQRFETTGCIPGFLNGGVVAFNAAFYLIPSLLHLNNRAVTLSVLFSFVGQFSMGVGVGLSLMHFVATMAWLGVIGSWGAYYASKLRQLEKLEFACTKTIVFVTKQHRTLLYSLIPSDVLEKVVRGVEIRATEVPRASVLFCELDMSGMDMTRVEEFASALGDLLARFDTEVKESGMFKYQHVATGAKHSFIVCCPRVSCPNDEREQSSEYPGAYVHSLLLLAFTLLDIAQGSVGWPVVKDSGEGGEGGEWKGGERGVKVRVGLSHGPVAAIVLGICRRYYGIYGNTVNMGARMAQHAEHGTVCVDSDLAAVIRASGDSGLQSLALVSLGQVQVKGKGPLEVFRVMPQRQHAAWHPELCHAHAAGAGAGGLEKRPRGRRHSAHSTLALGGFEQLRGEAESCDSADAAAAAGGRTAATEETDDPAAEANIAAWSQQFENAYVERRFADGQADADRLGLTAGLLFHLLIVAWQFLNVVVPANKSYFQGHGVEVVLGIVCSRQCVDRCVEFCLLRCICSSAYSSPNRKPYTKPDTPHPTPHTLHPIHYPLPLRS